MVASFDRRLDTATAKQKELTALIIAAFRRPEATREQFVDAMSAASMFANLTSDNTKLVDLSLYKVALRQYRRSPVGPALQHDLEEERKRTEDLNDRVAAMDEEDKTFFPIAGPADDDEDVSALDTKSVGRRSRSPSLAGIQSAHKKRLSCQDAFHLYFRAA